jgi:chromate transporter
MAETTPHPLATPDSSKELFITFTILALQGFGGVLAVAQRVLVEQKQWVTRAQFVETLSIAQVLPGPNVCNLALMIGDKFFGLRGAFAALAGMMLMPLIIVLILTVAYVQFADVPAVAGALRGMGAISAGLLIGTSLKLLDALYKNPMGLPLSAVLACMTFAAIVWLRWPLVWVLPGLGVPACLWAWHVLRRRAP